MSFDINRKFFARCNRPIRRIDWHPTEPWLLTGDNFGTVKIYNLESGAVIDTFEVADHSVFVKFIACKNWFIAGSINGQLYVFNYNTREKVIDFETQSYRIFCLAVHPTDPIVFTGGQWDIKAWDWDKQWRNVQTYQGDTSFRYITFNPKDHTTFVTVSFDGTVKMWSMASPIPDFTIKAHSKCVKHVEFYPGNKPYLVTASDDMTVKIWNYRSKTCVQTLQGHTDSVYCAIFHPNLPIIISGSQDRTVKIWNTRTFKNEHTLNYDLGRVWSLALCKNTNEVAVGFEKGVVTLEFGMDLYPQCTAVAMEVVAIKTRSKLIPELRDHDAQCMADFLSKVVDDEDAFTQSQRKYTLHLLSKLAKSAEVFPQSLELKGIQCNLTHPITAGGYGFIYKGEHEGSPICVKAVQVDLRGIDRKKLRVHASELIIWAHLLHPNVLPFLGIYASEEDVSRVCIVSPWMDNGDLVQYLGTVPDIPRKPLVRDIITGLQYLHDLDIIHADLKMKNVLVSEAGRAMLADFGISRLSMTQTTTSTTVAGSLHWMAPELLLDDKLPSRETDIWAFACTCYEIITGNTPFSQHHSYPLLLRAFRKGDIIPLKTTPGIRWDEDVWSLAMPCWQSYPASRPNAHRLLDVINSFNYLDDRLSSPESQRRRSSVVIDYNRILNIFSEIHESTPVLNVDEEPETDTTDVFFGWLNRKARELLHAPSRLLR